MENMKLRIELKGEMIFYYPDIMVSCDANDRHPFYREKPRLLMEVLSPSTVRTDKREKLLAYQQISSLQEYILIDQERILLTAYRRHNNWSPALYEQDTTLPLDAIHVELPVSQIYARVRFDEVPPKPF